MGKTTINYCDETWNVTGGCSHCSPGCDNCWSEQLTATRFKGKPRYDGLTKDGRWTGKVKLFEDRLEQPLHWKEPRVIFVNSQSDLFHEQVEPGWTCHVFDIIEQCPQHTFLLLTKRPRLMRKHLYGKWNQGGGATWQYMSESTTFPNLYLGLTICNQKEADEKIPVFLQIPGKKWLSIEPCLEDIDIRKAQCSIGGLNCKESNCDGCTAAYKGNYIGFDQVVLGGESGPKARPMEIEWARSLRDQCATANVSFFFKQWGTKKAGRLLDGVKYNDLIWRQ